MTPPFLCGPISRVGKSEACPPSAYPRGHGAKTRLCPPLYKLRCGPKPAPRSSDFRKPRLRCQHQRKIGFHVGVEREVEAGECAQQGLLVARTRIASGDEEFRRRHDVLAVDDA